jgi:hypothetical protein
MALDDFLEPEVGVAVLVTAAVASPRARKVMRTGLVYGLAGLLMAGEKIKGVATGVAEKARQAGQAVAAHARETATTPPTPTAAAPG